MQTETVSSSPHLWSELWDLATVLLPIAFASTLALVYGLIRLKEEKRLSFVERQLREFYSPIIGCVKRIRARSELRVEVSDAAERAWQKKVNLALKKGQDIDEDDPGEEYGKIIQYDNRQLREELLPDYEKMEQIFSANFWLASPKTRKWYPVLVKFVELWKRWLDRSMPGEVLDELDHTEEHLKPFYAHLEEEMDRLRSQLAKSKD